MRGEPCKAEGGPKKPDARGAPASAFVSWLETSAPAPPVWFSSVQGGVSGAFRWLLLRSQGFSACRGDLYRWKCPSQQEKL